MDTLALLDIGPFEFVLLAAAAVLLFGGDLPDVARKAARFVGRLRSLSADLNQELQKAPREFRPPPELQRPPELDRPDELGLDPADKDLFARPAPAPEDADWRPKSHEPFPEGGPGTPGSASPSPGSSETAPEQAPAEPGDSPGPSGGPSAPEPGPSAPEPGPSAPEPGPSVERREDRPPAGA